MENAIKRLGRPRRSGRQESWLSQIESETRDKSGGGSPAASDEFKMSRFVILLKRNAVHVIKLLQAIVEHFEVTKRR